MTYLYIDDQCQYSQIYMHMYTIQQSLYTRLWCHHHNRQCLTRIHQRLIVHTTNSKVIGHSYRNLLPKHTQLEPKLVIKFEYPTQLKFSSESGWIRFNWIQNWFIRSQLAWPDLQIQIKRYTRTDTSEAQNTNREGQNRLGKVMPPLYMSRQLSYLKLPWPMR